MEHKIQSSGGPLAMDLARVPKMLSTLRHHWAPQAFVVSFKVDFGMGIGVGDRTGGWGLGLGVVM